jgi:hypothetical protein
MNRNPRLSWGKKLPFANYILTGIPFLANSFGVSLANRDEPVLFCFPFQLAYLIFWVCVTPIFLWLADRSMRK